MSNYSITEKNPQTYKEKVPVNLLYVRVPKPGCSPTSAASCPVIKTDTAIILRYEAATSSPKPWLET